MDIWPVIHDQRTALAADLKGRSGEEWATPSLCGQWTVRDVLAHMTSAASLTPPAFFAKMIGSGFSFDKVQASGVAANRGSSPADTMTRFEAVLTSVKHPPGPADTWLGETIVHAEDIRRPLALRRDYPITTLTAAATYYQGSDLVIPARKRIAGLRLDASDGPFAAGAGPSVSGRTLALIMAMAGREAFCAELDGDGVATLRARCTTP